MPLGLARVGFVFLVLYELLGLETERMKLQNLNVEEHGLKCQKEVKGKL
jgi:hypothetical protein